MAMEELNLISNPGSASRKYGLYAGRKLMASLHFEQDKGKIICNLVVEGSGTVRLPSSLSHLTFAGTAVIDTLKKRAVPVDKGHIKRIALRIVAPAGYFQKHRRLDDRAFKKLAELEPRASLHINASLQEAHLMRKEFPKAELVGISDSAFHADHPDIARYYGLPLDDAKKYDVLRFGYHGLSVESVVNQLKAAGRLPKRLVVCHLGSGASVTAVRGGRSVDNTMGYSPLEGLVMSTRSGSLDITAAQALAAALKLSDDRLQQYLNDSSGLLGLSGESSDIRELLKLEQKDHQRAQLALALYVYKTQQAVGQMAAALGGIDSLAFTGTVGERSAEIRKRVISHLLFLGLSLDAHANHGCSEPDEPQIISPASHPAKVLVVPADEHKVMLGHALEL